jgi:uncharacterized protein (TIGR02391 family)
MIRKLYSFTYQFCRNGHMLYSHDGTISRKKCQQCGESYVAACENCNTALQNSFSSPVYLTNRQPVSFPSRPDFCPECGNVFPWAKGDQEVKVASFEFWDMLHPSVTGVARERFDSGHYADAVEAALKALNVQVKKIYKTKTGEELDGVPLMRKAFAHTSPIIQLGDLTEQTGRNIQQGYMDLFTGAIAGIRNPKAHDNIVIDNARAIHHLFVTSLLFYKLDERL